MPHITKPLQKIVSLLVPFWALIQPDFAGASQAPSSSTGQAIADYLGNLVKNNRFSGTAVLSLQGMVDLELASGFANMESSQGNGSDTAFRIGGVSRIFTSAIILKLVQEGRLHLDDRIRKFIDGFDDPDAASITLHDLLLNSSGIPEYLFTWKNAFRMRLYEEQGPKGGIAGTIADITSLDLAFAPGSRSEPSHSNYQLLARTIERASGETFSAGLKRLVGSFNLTRTGYDLSKEVPAAFRAVGYEPRPALDPRSWWRPHERVAAPWRHPDWDSGSAGLFSSGHDLLNFTTALLENRVLSKNLTDKLFTPVIRRTGTVSQAYGWEIHELPNSQRGIVIAGATRGYWSLVAHLPERAATLVVLSNSGETLQTRTRIVKDLLQLLATR